VKDKADSVLVQAAVGGDEKSFVELCRRYYPQMLAIAHAILDDKHLAEDAAQQAFAKAVPELRRLRKPERFGAWLAAICRNVARDAAARRQINVTTRPLESLQAATESDTDVEAVRAAVNRLPRRQKEIIFLRYYDEMSYEKISAVLGISPQAVNGRLRRAKTKIALYLRRNGFKEVLE